MRPAPSVMERLHVVILLQNALMRAIVMRTLWYWVQFQMPVIVVQVRGWAAILVRLSALPSPAQAAG